MSAALVLDWHPETWRNRVLDEFGDELYDVPVLMLDAIEALTYQPGDVLELVTSRDGVRGIIGRRFP